MSGAEGDPCTRRWGEMCLERLAARCGQPPASVARRDGDLPLLKPVEEAILTSKPSSIRRMLVLNPRALAQSAFITSQNSNTVWVIDTVTTTVVVTIPVLSNSYGVAVNPNGRRVY